MIAPPVLAVSAVVIDHGELLLIERGAGPARGQWAVPGGRLEPGEPLKAAVAREVREETALAVEPTELIGLNEVISDVSHYVVACYRADLRGHRDPTAGSDAAAVAWVPLGAVASMTMVPGVLGFLHEHGVVPR